MDDGLGGNRPGAIGPGMLTLNNCSNYSFVGTASVCGGTLQLSDYTNDTMTGKIINAGSCFQRARRWCVQRDDQRERIGGAHWAGHANPDREQQLQRRHNDWPRQHAARSTTRSMRRGPMAGLWAMYSTRARWRSVASTTSRFRGTSAVAARWSNWATRVTRAASAHSYLPAAIRIAAARPSPPAHCKLATAVLPAVLRAM